MLKTMHLQAQLLLNSVYSQQYLWRLNTDNKCMASSIQHESHLAPTTHKYSRSVTHLQGINVNYRGVRYGQVKQQLLAFISPKVVSSLHMYAAINNTLLYYVQERE